MIRNPISAITVGLLLIAFSNLAVASASTVDSNTDWQDEGTFFNTTSNNGNIELVKNTTFNDGHEDGDMDEWGSDNDGSCCDGQFSATQSQVAVGGWASFGNSDSGNNIATERNLDNNPAPNKVEGWIQVEDAGSASSHRADIEWENSGTGVLRVKVAPGTSQEVRVNGVTMFNRSSASDLEDKWYHFELEHIDWANNEVGMVYINGVQNATNVAFESSASELTHVDYNQGLQNGDMDVYRDATTLDNNHTVDGNWTGNTKTYGTGTQNLENFQVDVTSLPSGTRLWTTLEKKNASNATVKTDVIEITSTGTQNLSTSIAQFENFRFSFNMTRGSTPQIDSATVFHSDKVSAGIGSPGPTDSDVHINESGDTMTGLLDMNDNDLFNVSRVTGTFGEPSDPIGARNVGFYSDIVITNNKDLFGIELASNPGDGTVIDFAPFGPGGPATLQNPADGEELRLITDGGNILMDSNGGDVATRSTLNMQNNMVNNTDMLNLRARNEPVCDHSTEGNIIYNGTNHLGCNGTSWNRLY